MTSRCFLSFRVLISTRAQFEHATRAKHVPTLNHCNSGSCKKKQMDPILPLSEYVKFRLHFSGELNEETRKQFETPRCGMSDRLSSKRKRRYLLQGNKWDLSSTKDVSSCCLFDLRFLLKLNEKANKWFPCLLEATTSVHKRQLE